MLVFCCHQLGVLLSAKWLKCLTAKMSVSKRVSSSWACTGACSLPWFIILLPPFPVLPCASRMNQHVSAIAPFCSIEIVLVYLTSWKVLFGASMRLCICIKAVDLDWWIVSSEVHKSLLMPWKCSGVGNTVLSTVSSQNGFQKARNECNCYSWQHWQAKWPVQSNELPVERIRTQHSPHVHCIVCISSVYDAAFKKVPNIDVQPYHSKL